MARANYTQGELEQMSAAELEKLLTKREVDFVEHFIVSKNATQAAISAGYCKSGNRDAAAVAGCRLLRKAKTLAYMRARQREIYNQLNITPESVAGDLINIYKRSICAVPVTEYDKDLGEMVATGEFVYDSRAALKALELIGDSIGMFEKGMKLRGEGEIKITIPDSVRDMAK